MFLGVLHQLDQILPQRRLAPGEADVGHAHLPQQMQRVLPGLGGQFALHPPASLGVERAGAVCAVGQGQIDAVGSRAFGRKRIHPFQVQVGHRAEIGRGGQGEDVVAQAPVVGASLCAADAVSLRHRAHGLLLVSSLDEQASVLRGGLVQV